jgi:adenylylsulfate kinase-like enzyme
VARLMVDAGLIVIVAFISPCRRQRAAARALFAPGDFVEIFIDTPLAVCEQRDPKGMYARARRGELKDFTGVDAPYEAPSAPEIRVDASLGKPAETLAAMLLRL